MCDGGLVSTLFGGGLKTPERTSGSAPTRDDAAVRKAEDDQRRRTRNAQGRSANVLTRAVETDAATSDTLGG